MTHSLATTSHPLFELIRNEHKEIRQWAALLGTASEDRNLLIQLLKTHHHKEEAVLFAAIQRHPRLSEGGPMCTYFFDEQITSPPLETAKKLTGSEPCPPPQTQHLWKTHGPLHVPLGEHLTIQHLLEQAPPEVITKNRERILYIIERNIRKEEDCFFHVCVKLLDGPTLDDLYLRWVQFII